MPHRRMMLNQIILGLLLLLLGLSGSAWSQALPHNEQRFCSAFPIFREALKQARASSTDDSPHQQRQLRQAVVTATKDFRRGAGWRSPSQQVKGWLGDLHSITESTPAPVSLAALGTKIEILFRWFDVERNPTDTFRTRPGRFTRVRIQTKEVVYIQHNI